MIIEVYVKVIRDGKKILEPVEDYLDNAAFRYGFDSYEELKSEGYGIFIPKELYGKNGEVISDSDTLEIINRLSNVGKQS